MIVGTGDQEGALRLQATQLGVSTCVHFCGQVPRNQIGSYFAAADVFAMTSWVDGVPNVLLEALAAGLPVVSTDTGVAPDLIQHGRTGYVIPPGDCVELASALEGLLLDLDHARLVGRQGRDDLMGRNLSHDRKALAYLGVYNRVRDMRTSSHTDGDR